MELICPYCGKKIHKTLVGQVRCDHCALNFKDYNGILIMTKNDKFYYGEITKNETSKLLLQTKQHGWEKAFRQFLKGKDAPVFLKRYVLDEHRAAWKFLLNISQNNRVCDIGCGWGSIGISLARNYQNVVSVDLTKERLFFLSERCKQLGIGNIDFICGGDTPYLPFPDKYFDSVVLNGVLEWVAISRAGEPHKVQLDFLREVKRILKEKGQIYVGIENRFNYQYFLNKRDDHTNLRYGSLLPRPIANIYSLIVRRKPYRTYTYSYREYKKILKKAGFYSSRTFIPVHDYRKFSHIIDPNNRNWIRGYFTRGSENGEYGILKRLKTKGLKIFAPAFLIFGAKYENKSCFLEDLLLHINKKCDIFRQENLKMENIRTYHLSSDGAEVVFVHLGGVRSDCDKYILKLPLSFSSAASCNRHKEGVEKIFKFDGNNEFITNKLPKLALSGDYRGQTYHIESAIHGLNAKKYVNLEPLRSITIKKQALEYISELCKISKHTVLIDDHKYEEMVGFDIKRIQKILEKEHQYMLFKINDFLKDVLIEVKWVLSFIHGDFWVGNMLFDKKNNKVTGVLDWDCFQENFSPLLDVIHFLAYNRYGGRLSCGDAFKEYLFEGRILIEEPEVFKLYKELLEIDIDNKFMKVMTIIYWLTQVSRKGLRFEHQRFDNEWLEKIVHIPLKYFFNEVFVKKTI